MMERPTRHELTTNEKKLERQSGRKDWYPNAEEFLSWATGLKADYSADEIFNVFRETYP